jgi:hypothetical protein
MATCIHVYSEVRKNNEWAATERHTFNEERPNRFGWVNASMKRNYCPEKYPFYGLLLDGARYSWPWSFHQKGIPQDVSEEVRAVCDSFGFEGYGHSHLTLRELVEKYLELMASGDEAKELLGYLRELISTLTPLSEDHDDVRIVFWFDS